MVNGEDLTAAELAERVIAMLLHSRGKPFVASQEQFDNMAGVRVTFTKNNDTGLVTLWIDKPDESE
jgi:hypothetical protein